MIFARWDRIILAGIISLLCYGATYYWYRTTEKTEVSAVGRTPIAYLTKLENEVERRPVTRQIWQGLQSGDPVFAGEAVRTSSHATALLQTADGGRTIELDPDTLIVISQQDQNVALDLMDGRLFVHQNEKAEASKLPALVLRSADAEIDLSRASVKLSKGTGTRVDVEVTKGSAKVRGAQGSQEIAPGKRLVLGQVVGEPLAELQILSPLDSSTIYVSPDQEAPVHFAWKGIPAGAEVRVETGTSSKDLKPTGDWVPAGQGFLDAILPAGRHIWKLSARMPGSTSVFAEGPIESFRVVRTDPAELLFPDDQTVLQTKTNEDSFVFRWKRPVGVVSQKIEFALNSEFQPLFRDVKVLAGDTIQLEMPPGSYFWRVSSTYEGFSQPVMSRPFTLTLLPPVVRVDVAFTNFKHNDVLTYVGAPVAVFQWKTNRPDVVQRYVFRLAQTTEALRGPASDDKLKRIETKQTQVTPEITRGGRYLAMVEAYDENDKLVGKTDVQALSFEPKASIRAPQFEPLGQDLLADNQGALSLIWGLVEGAKEYWLTLKDPSGKEIQKSRFLGTSAKLQSLLPGEYKVEIYAIDQYGRRSKEVPARRVVVPTSSGLNAPKLKKVKVQ